MRRGRFPASWCRGSHLQAPDLELLRAAALEAGAIALRHAEGRPDVWQKAGGAGPVSAADLEIDRMLRATLLGARPDYGWLSEESAPVGGKERVFVVDPIDGTRAYIAGEPSFSHALAVVEGGRTVAAVVHLPRLGVTFEAVRGEGARCNGQRLAVSARTEIEGASVLAARTQLDPALWPGGAPPVERHFRPALSWRLCLVAEGAFDAMLTLRDAWHWDIAAGSLIAEEAGAHVSDRHGARLDFAGSRVQSPGVLAAPEALHRALVARLRG